MALLRFVLAGSTGLIGLLVIALVMVVGLPFLTVTLLTRAIARVVEPQSMPWRQLIEFDPTFGWRPKPNLKAHHLVDDVFSMTTDAHGWRGKSSLAESDLVVIGDSFASGYGIDDRNFFADLNPRLRMKAIGTNGYNMVQELLWMERLAPLLAGKVVVWFIYVANDLYDNLVPNLGKYRRPWIRQRNSTGDWEIIRTHLSPANWPFTFERYCDGIDYGEKLADLCSQTLLADRAYGACAWLIRNGREVCRKADAELAVVTIPHATQLHSDGMQWLRVKGSDSKSFDPGLPDQKIGRICRELGIPFIAGKAYLHAHHYKEHDCHWNKRGHRRICELLTSCYYEVVADKGNFVSDKSSGTVQGYRWLKKPWRAEKSRV